MFEWANERKSGVVATEEPNAAGIGADLFIPYDPTNEQGALVIAWVAKGNTIGAYQAPAPTKLEKMETRLAALEAK